MVTVRLTERSLIVQLCRMRADRIPRTVPGKAERKIQNRMETGIISGSCVVFAAAWSFLYVRIYGIVPAAERLHISLGRM